MKRIESFSVVGNIAKVQLYPKTHKHSRSEFDIVRMRIKSKDDDGKKNDSITDMTPDEAMELSTILSTAMLHWMSNYKPYFDTFIKWKLKHMKKSRQL